MSPRVKLSDIIDSISLQSHNTLCYLDRKKGELFLVSQDQLLALARKILVDDKEEKYIAIPIKFVSHEYSTMDNFCLSLGDKEIYRPLFRAIIGRGAFRRFSDCIHHFGIADDWYRYRFNAMKRIVIDWCKANNIEYIEA